MRMVGHVSKVQVTADVLAYNALLGAFASEADFESAFKLIKESTDKPA